MPALTAAGRRWSSTSMLATRGCLPSKRLEGNTQSPAWENVVFCFQRSMKSASNGWFHITPKLAFPQSPFVLNNRVQEFGFFLLVEAQHATTNAPRKERNRVAGMAV